MEDIRRRFGRWLLAHPLLGSTLFFVLAVFLSCLLELLKNGERFLADPAHIVLRLVLVSAVASFLIYLRLKRLRADN